MPMGIFVVSLVIAILLLLCRTKEDKEKYTGFRGYFQRVYLVASISLYVTYPAMMLVYLQSVHCVEMEGVQRLWSNPEVTCSGDRYENYFYAVSVPSIVIWMGLAPLIWILSQTTSFLQIWTARSTRQREHARESYLYTHGFLVLGLKKASGKDTKGTDVDRQRNVMSLCCSRLFSPISGTGCTIEKRGGKKNFNSFYHWEAIIYLQKVLLCTFAVFSSAGRLEL